MQFPPTMQELLVVPKQNRKQLQLYNLYYDEKLLDFCLGRIQTPERTLTSERARGVSDTGSKKDTALPMFPHRPVLPMRCTYSSMCLGMSKLTTCWTWSMSSPLAATDVATKTGHWPVRKSLRAFSRSRCSRSLWTEINVQIKLIIIKVPQHIHLFFN